MTRTRAHTCVFFDDGEPDLACACGARALDLAEEGAAEPLLVLLSETVSVAVGVVAPIRTREAHQGEYAVSA